MVPHLITALTGPINELEQRIIDSMPAIERWFRLEWMEHTPLFYASADIRNSGFKLAPVETNLFPSRWSHLTEQMLPLAVQASMASVEKICPEARNLLIIPENGTPAQWTQEYLASLAQLERIFKMAGLNVRIGSIDPELKTPLPLELESGAQMLLEPVVRAKRRLVLKHFDPCTILLNNDLSAGVPGILEELHEQYLMPPLHASWSVRRKSRHFQSYEEVAKRFGKMLGIDHWLIYPIAARVVGLEEHSGDGDDANNSTALEALCTQLDALLTKVRRKYKEYGIKEKPFAFIKVDNGTYGQGIMRVRDSKELRSLWESGAARQCGIAPAHPGAAMPELMIQEGVQTCERMREAVAQPVVYTMDRYVVGGFYRMHAERSADENLNAPGSSYAPLAFAHSAQMPQLGASPGASAPNRFYMYGVLARLAMLAASYELEATDPDAEQYD